jgi:hypothetical protein
MQKRKLPPSLLIPLLVATAVASCATFPKEQLTLDLSNEVTPVAFNEVKAAGRTRTFTYEAGYKSQTVSSSASSGNATATVSVTMSANQNQPLGSQMQTIFISDPEWAAITSLVFSVDLTNAFSSTTSLMLKTEAEVPFRK